MADHNEIGKKGEALAQRFLQERGYKLLATNWRFQRAEIDIIAETEEVLVVVEVKTRTSLIYENPKEAVTKTKQKQLVKAADAYLQEHAIDKECRFDIVSVIINKDEPTIEHLMDAFYPLL